MDYEALLKQQFHSSWNLFVKRQESIFSEILGLYNQYNLTPNPEYLFKAFEMPVSDIKMVIVGQDPYPNGEGVGYAFAYNPNFPKPVSFKRLEKVIEQEFSPDLKQWEEKGIFSINAFLTTKLGEANTMRDFWNDFTRELMMFLDAITDNTIFVFMGRVAQNYADYIGTEKDTGHKVYFIPHPAARGNKFFNEAKILKQLFNNLKIN